MCDSYLRSWYVCEAMYGRGLQELSKDLHGWNDCNDWSKYLVWMPFYTYQLVILHFPNTSDRGLSNELKETNKMEKRRKKKKKKIKIS